MLDRVRLGGLYTTLRVQTGGSASLWSTYIVSMSPVANDGRVASYGSTLVLVHGQWGATFVTGDADWAATATVPWPTWNGFGVTCTAAGLTSVGHNRTGFGCALGGVGDSTGLVLDELEGPDRLVPVASSPLVDAIPVGESGCLPGTVDLFGNPRGVDGNGDGISGCDVGAVERQP